MTTEQIEIDVEAVIATAARTAVAQSCPELPEAKVQQAVDAALVREAMSNARSMAKSAE